jgi:hypothetical protein
MLAQGFKETIGMAGAGANHQVNQNRLLLDPNAQPVGGPLQPGFPG